MKELSPEHLSQFISYFKINYPELYSRFKSPIVLDYNYISPQIVRPEDMSDDDYVKSQLKLDTWLAFYRL